MGRYTFLDDIALADCAMEVEAKDLDDLFETAAAAPAALLGRALSRVPGDGCFCPR